MTNSLEPGSTYSHDAGTRATWYWRFEDAGGAEVSPAEGSTAAGAPRFTSQSDAESWIGETWHELLDEGVDQVSLFEADRQVYGPMSLHSQS